MCLRFHVLIAAISLFAAGCQSPVPTNVTDTRAVVLQFDSNSLSFKHPKTGHIFKLHLGDELHHDTGGITPVPSNIRHGNRDATSSYYEPLSESGSGYAAAESLYTHDQADIVARNSDIQYQPDSGRLLITEDKSDGLPCKRYILYTLLPEGGYRVSYLSPPWHVNFAAPGLPSSPPDIHLLPGDRAKIEGEILKIEEIEQSAQPFSLGG